MEESERLTFKYSLKLHKLKAKKIIIDERIAQLQADAIEEGITLEEFSDDVAFYTMKVDYVNKRKLEREEQKALKEAEKKAKKPK